MYGLLIIDEHEEVIKVASSEEKLHKIIQSYIVNYFISNNVEKKQTSKILEALSVREVNIAIELFCNLTEKINNEVFMTLSKVTFELDS